MSHPMSPEEARRALGTVAAGRRYVVETTRPLPYSGFAVLIAFLIGLAAFLDMPDWPGRSLLFGILLVGYLIAIVVVPRQRRIKLRVRGIGFTGALALMGFFIGAPAIHFLVAPLTERSGVPFPATLNAVAVSLYVIAGVTVLNPFLRRARLRRVERVAR